MKTSLAFGDLAHERGQSYPLLRRHYGQLEHVCGLGEAARRQKILFSHCRAKPSRSRTRDMIIILSPSSSSSSHIINHGHFFLPHSHCITSCISKDISVFLEQMKRLSKKRCEPMLKIWV